MPIQASEIADVVGLMGDLAALGGQAAQNTPLLRPAYQQVCRIWAGTGVPQTAEAIGLSTACTPYLAEDGRTMGGSSPPFTGGQCDVLYNYQAQFTVDGVPTGPFFQVNFKLGPLSYQTGTRDGRSFAEIIDGNGDVATGGSVAPGMGTQGINVQNMVRADGGVDDCGDPDDVFQPGDGYQGEEYDVPVTLTDPLGNPRVVVVSPPIEGPDGISIPVNVDGIDVEVGLPSATVPEPETPELGDWGPLTNINSGASNNLPDPPEGQRVSAVFVELFDVPATEGTIAGTGPQNEKYYRAMGELAFRIEDNSGVILWSQNMTIRSKRGVFTTPEEAVSIKQLRIAVRPGITARYRALFRPI